MKKDKSKIIGVLILIFIFLGSVGTNETLLIKSGYDYKEAMLEAHKISLLSLAFNSFIVVIIPLILKKFFNDFFKRYTRMIFVINGILWLFLSIPIYNWIESSYAGIGVVGIVFISAALYYLLREERINTKDNNPKYKKAIIAFALTTLFASGIVVGYLVLEDKLDEQKDEPKEEVKIDPFDLKEEYYKESKMAELDLEGLEKLIEDKESFGVFVYLPGCTSCAAFSEVLNDFQKQNKITFYKTQIKYAKETDIGNKIKYAPSFVIFKEGEIVAYLDAESNDDLPVYENVDNFKEWLTKYIILK